MKNFSAALILLCYLFLLYSSDIKAQTDDAEEWIKNAVDKMEKAMVNGDYQYIMDLYVDDVISLPNFEPLVKGKENIEKNMKESVNSGFKFNSVDFETLEVFGDGDYVYEIGAYKMNMTLPGMNEPIEDTGKYLTVWEKTDDGYKIKVETWNTDSNPMGGGM